MKRRFKKAIVSTATTTMAIAGVAAIGVSLTQCAKDDPTPANDYWLVKSQDTLKGKGDIAVLIAYHNGDIYNGAYETTSKNIAISGDIITLNTPPSAITPVTIIETTHNITTTITLLPDDPVPIPFGGNYATWEELDNETTQIFTLGNDGTIMGVNSTNLSSKMQSLDRNGIDFGDNVASIGENAFRDCSSLGESGTVQYLKFTSVSYVDRGAFCNCAGLRQVYLGGGATINHELSIGRDAFYGCVNLAYFGVDATARFTAIGTDAFADCASFTNRDFFQVSDANLNNLGAWDINTNANKGGWIKNLQTGSAPQTCLGCIAFGEIDINALDFIGESAFDNCASLKVVDSWTNKGLGKNSIGNWAFEKCVNLVNITVPNFVTLIHTGAFSDCANLSTITLPTSVTIIDNYAFYNCARLTNFEFVESDSSSTSLSIGDHAFVGCANLKLIQLATKTSTTWTGANWFDSCPVFGTIKSNQLATSANMVDWITRLPGEGNTAWYGLQNPAE